MKSFANKLAFYLAKRKYRSVDPFIKAADIACLNYKHFSQEKMRNECVNTVSVVMPTLSDYTRLLNGILKALESDVLFDIRIYPIRPDIVVVRNLFIDEQNNLVDVQKAVKEFAQLCQHSLAQYEANKHHQLHALGHNTRMLRKALISCSDLCAQLRNHYLS